MKRTHGFLLLLFLFTLFQNCSPKQFNAKSDRVEDFYYPIPTLPEETFTETFTAMTEEKITKVDLLFVLDESASMAAISSELANEMKSIAATKFPQDTRVAVTNMAPAKFLNNGTFDLNQAYYGASTAFQPGFVKLVNATSIDSFLHSYPTYSDRFPLKGCGSWFLPAAKNSDGESCLSAHTQIALIVTGVEAGTVSLQQLLKTTNGNAARTFRENSFVNIIFVSDTHDAGFQNYYGSEGAPSQIPSYENLRRLIEETNPDLKGVKFHGIVPLPPAGDARLNGVKTIGSLPMDFSESRLGGEELNDFSYLPLIAKSGGSAIHPKGNSWVKAIEQMITEVAVKRSTTISTSKPIGEILSIFVNGKLLENSKYSLISTDKVEVLMQEDWPATIEIKIEYISSDFAYQFSG